LAGFASLTNVGLFVTKLSYFIERALSIIFVLSGATLQASIDQSALSIGNIARYSRMREAASTPTDVEARAPSPIGDTPATLFGYVQLHSTSKPSAASPDSGAIAPAAALTVRLSVCADFVAIPDAAHAPHWIVDPTLPCLRIHSDVASRKAFAALYMH
jgi:hypothetical protein